MPHGTQDVPSEGRLVSDTGVSPSLPQLPSRFSYETTFSLPEVNALTSQELLQPLTSNARTLTLARFRLVPFRSPLLGESRLISFPTGTEMFQFPALALAEASGPA